MPAALPYFFSEALRSRFTQDIQYATDEARITSDEGRWLRSLVATDTSADSGTTFPRVDRLTIEDGSAGNAELAGALFISDPDNADAPVFLSTLAFGIERFASRSLLLAGLQQRLAEVSDMSIVEADRVEDALFEARSLAVIRQQARYLEDLWTLLQDLPDLYSACGKALQAVLLARGLGDGIDVFTQIVQILEMSPAADPGLPSVVGTQYLIDAAVQVFIGELIPTGLTRQFLDARGDILSQAQSTLFEQALSDSVSAVSAAYEQLLVDYWTSLRPDGRTVKDFATRALAECFRQHLLSSRAHGAMTDAEYRHLLTLLPSSPEAIDAQSIRVRRLSVSVAGQEPVKLVGVALIEFPADELAGVYLYSSLSGLLRFSDSANAIEHVLSDPSRNGMLFYSSLDDHVSIRMQGPVEVRQDTLATEFFSDFVGSLIALQKRNLRYALALPAIDAAKIPVRVDDALDIRGLLDGRLLNLHDSGRWRSERLTFDQAWGASVQTTSVQPSLIPEPSYNWVSKLKKLDWMLERVDALHTGVDSCMRLALNRYLAVIGGPHLDAWMLWVLPDAIDAPPVRLLSLALDRVCGYAPAPLSGGVVLAGLLKPVMDQPVQRLPLALIEQILSCVQLDFPRRFNEQISEFYSRSIRHLDTRLRPDVMCGLIREYSLRLELLVEKRIATLPDSVIANVQQVLDRPLPALRAALGEARVDAFTVSVEYDPQSAAIKVPNAFVINNRLPGNKPALWIVNKGLICFETLQVLEQYVAERFTGKELGSHLPGVLAEPDRQTLLDYRARKGALTLKVVLQRIEGHFIEALQHDEIERQRRTMAELYQQAVTWRVPSELFVNLLGAGERDDRNRQNLSHLGVAIQFIIYKAIVPSWVREASRADQVMLIDALRRFYVTCAGKKDFLFDIPSLYEYSCEQLRLRFQTDFTEPRPDPENIRVTLKHFVPAPVAPGQTPQSIPAATDAVSENLAEFAINRFLSRQDGVILLSSRDDQPLNASLTPAYVRELVKSLDIAAGYRSLLDSRLAVTAADYPERRRLFVEQVPSLDILQAFALRLKNELSEQAYQVIENVLSMPDALARLPVNGCKVVLSPLQLLPAKEGWEPTVVLNTYLMGPMDNQPGPWVLYAPLHEDFVFKEYPDRAALLHDIHTSAFLQQYILDRVDPDVRKLYDNGGFMEPHLPFSAESSFDFPFETPAPVTLQIDPYEGNCLLLMFRGALDILKLQVQQHSVTNAEQHRATSRYLFTLGAEQVMALMPGRVGALIGIIQGQTLLNMSVISAGDQSWGKAFSEFMAALSVMISSGQAPSAFPSRAVDEVNMTAEEAVLSDPLVQLDDDADVPEFSWSNSSLTQQIRERLRQFEVHDVALNTLQRDELLSTYHDPLPNREYAAIGGKIYELKSDANGWFIVSGTMVGPPVSLDADQQWKLDIQGGLRGGGGALTRMEGSLVDDLVDDIMVVNARGMSEIRHSYREMALAIEDAHKQAQYYLENSLANLAIPESAKAVEPRTEKIIADFFGQKNPDDRLYDVTKKTITDIYQELMNPSMSPIDSQRYVVGINRMGNEASSAFIFEADPLRRVFLTEQFFRVPTYRFKLSAIRSGEFKHGPHYRAAILIHELSHMVLKTDDIAYVDSQAPYVDLIEDTPTYRLRIRNELITQQQKTLSYQTDRDKLFKQLDEDTWRDLRRMDGNGKQTILRICGKKTLEEARDVFYQDVHKRTDVMLKNADSVALLVTLLGRERFVRR
ncbi:dermonecrotic toxin domain-containing protein [Pseudomonas syringae]|uniref:dermonecrotic toxin domain-containing protein n=1 Tax=Pseudomonas syringae TaxID=317 RepID=UPI001F0D8D93|nr:DUF6543 domain-containing protein [Pseudomonas syringae]MCH5513790.1 hypothetical protein [Pseudomonas syringae pv. syringae]MCH5627600.1 hypothetical protein [Pseudomonas syringae pv. syringae]